MVLPSIHAVNTSNWTHCSHDRFRLALSLLPFVSSDVYRTKGSHFWIKATRGRRRSYVEQHARLQLHLSPPDVLAGLCWCEVRQQTGFHLPGLCHRFHRLHLHRSARLCLQTSSFPVSQELFVFGKSALAVDLGFFFEWPMSFLICSVCILGNRTISGHVLDDSLCVKTINVPMKGPEEGADTNFTVVMGKKNMSTSDQIGLH